MNKLTTLIVITTFPLVLSAGESINRSLPADPQGIIEFKVVRGMVKLLGWDESKVQVEGTLDDHAKELVFEREGNQIILKVKTSKNIDSGEGSKLTVHVPVASQLEVNGISTDFSITGTRGKVDASTISGDLAMDRVDGAIAADSVSGDISIKAGAGNVEANSISGDIKIEGGGDTYELATVSGDVRLSGSVLDKLEGGTVSGDVRVQAGLSSAAQVELDSVSGNISLILNDDIHARFSLETGPGGEIRNRLSDDKPAREKYTGAESLTLTLGNGDGRIEMETFSGTLSLSR